MSQSEPASRSGPPPAAELDASLVREMGRRFRRRTGSRLMQNAVTTTAVDDIALNREVITGVDHTFSHLLDDWEVTNQEKSGRCWLFAGLNLLRVGAMEQMKLKNFEFSQNYPMFWDKLERANHFYECIIDTAGLEQDDRTVGWLLGHPIDDGGQWNMFVNLVRKYGLVPKSAMPETQSSANTGRMNQHLQSQLRQGARDLRQLAAQGQDAAALRTCKQQLLDAVYRILCIHLGTPPETVDWQWTDKDKAFHRDGSLTPQEFAAKHVTLPVEDYVCLVNDPRETSPYGRTFTVQYLGNVVGAGTVLYLNVEIGLMKEIAMRTIMGGEPVWMGCDVGKMMAGKLGVWDAGLFDFDGVYGTRSDLDKAERLGYHDTAMTHAMLFTGVDVVGGRTPRPRRWRVENSWGDERGRKGFYLMNDNWFDEHMFEIAARRTDLPPDLQRALEEPPIVLPPWDPMGSLAMEAQA